MPGVENVEGLLRAAVVSQEQSTGRFPVRQGGPGTAPRSDLEWRNHFNTLGKRATEGLVFASKQ